MVHESFLSAGLVYLYLLLMKDNGKGARQDIGKQQNKMTRYCQKRLHENIPWSTNMPGSITTCSLYANVRL